jgi:hypothetical protein
MSFPTDEDLTSVAMTVLIIRHIPAHIAKGKITGVKILPQLDPDERFELGRILYNYKDYDDSSDSIEYFCIY